MKDTDRRTVEAASPPDVAPVLHLSLDGDELSVRQALTRVNQWLLALETASDLRDRVMIVLAEALNNVVEHAFAGGAGDRIDLAVRVAGGGAVLEIVDDGRAMPGTTPPKPACCDIDVPIADLPEGGFGWNLIHDIANEVVYCREETTNRLRLCVPADERAAP